MAAALHLAPAAPDHIIIDGMGGFKRYNLLLSGDANAGPEIIATEGCDCYDNAMQQNADLHRLIVLLQSICPIGETLAVQRRSLSKSQFALGRAADQRAQEKELMKLLALLSDAVQHFRHVAFPYLDVLQILRRPVSHTNFVQDN